MYKCNKFNNLSRIYFGKLSTPNKNLCLNFRSGSISIVLSIILLLSLGFNPLLAQRIETEFIGKNNGSLAQTKKLESAKKTSEFGFLWFVPIYSMSLLLNKNFIKQDNKASQGVAVSSSIAKPVERRGKSRLVSTSDSSSQEKVVMRKWVIITAYSSTPDQTDSTPFITASNTYVYDGVVAANFLPFGTKIKIPSLFDDKIFTIEDRMKSNKKVDIWFSTRQEARNFGVRRAEIEILENF